jgi:hypothetical protein
MASWLEALEKRGREAIGIPSATPAVIVPRQPKPEIKSLWVTLRNPNLKIEGDTGNVEAAFYYVTDGVLYLCDETGKSTGKSCQLGGDDPRHIAHRLFLEKWRSTQSDFNRPLGYARGGYA